MSDTIKVTNRSNGSVIYNLPERNIRREFYPKESKILEKEELIAVTALPGGRELIYNYLIIEDEDALHEILNIKEEAEYWLTEEKIPLFLKSSTIDEFKDALDFAPMGVLELIKKYSVTLPLNDVEKREALFEQTGFNVTRAIENNKIEASEEEEQKETVNSARRVANSSYKDKITYLK